jgi:hypothetical protein
MKNRPVCGHSSQTSSYLIDMNNNHCATNLDGKFLLVHPLKGDKNRVHMCTHGGV